MGRKLREVTLADFGLEMRGNTLILTYMGQTLEEKNLSLYGLVHSNIQALVTDRAHAKVEQEIADAMDIESLTEQEVYNFVNVFKTIQYKYARVRRTYSRDGRYWVHFKRAAAFCKKQGMTPEMFVSTVVAGYSKMNRGSTVTMPWPSQFYGETAEQILASELASRGTVAIDGDEGRRAAHLNKSIPLDKDERYQNIKKRIKAKQPYTVEDLEYCGTRQVQVYGRRAKWVATYAEELKINEREETEQETAGAHT